MNIERRKLIRNSASLVAGVIATPLLAACAHSHPHRVKGHKHAVYKRKRLRWARPHVLYIPNRALYVGAYIILPDGREARIKRVHKQHIDVVIENKESSIKYEIELIEK